MKIARNIVIVAVAAVALLALTFGATGCMATPEGGEVMIIRNGGPFDDKQIRQVVPNGAGNTWIGFGSQAHPYPASDQQRLYKFDDTPDADAKPVEVPTKDGVRVRLTGTFYINTAFDGTPEGEKLLRAFDTSFGTRAFTGAEGSARPWEEGGWEIFLNAILQPIIDSNIREVIAEFDCKQLVSSCALVQRGGAAAVDAEEVAGTDNKSNVTVIQDRINQNLTRRSSPSSGSRTSATSGSRSGRSSCRACSRRSTRRRARSPRSRARRPGSPRRRPTPTPTVSASAVTTTARRASGSTPSRRSRRT